MPANVETMFYTREAPWHGLGIRVEETLTSSEALEKSGLNWKVVQRPIMTSSYAPIPGYKANVRVSDGNILGVVTDRYKVVQNSEAFAFTDALIGEWVRYETAGSLQDGRKIWLLAKLPERYSVMDEEIEPYLVFKNSRYGTGSIKVCMTPVRVVCQNTLNLAISSAKRIWSSVHVGNLADKTNEARNTLALAQRYMDGLGAEFGNLAGIRLSDSKVYEYINMLIPEAEDGSDIHKRNIEKVREDLKTRYFDAPDLRDVGKNGYRFICAVSDFATHAKPLREPASYRENVFSKTVEGNPLIDRAYEMISEAA
jgi:phage/plasmid-like protein (TIGR03299 family)